MRFYKSITALLCVFFSACSGAGTFTLTTPIDDFFVDLNNPGTDLSVTRTAPYFGENASCPHNGAHVHFSYSGSAEYGCVAITAPFAATIDEIQNCKDIGESDGFQINLRFADAAMNAATFEMSLEPQDGFHCNSSDTENYYDQFIFVHAGSLVAAGETIACLPVYGTDDAVHIHFNLRAGGVACPNIFSESTTQNFASFFDASAFVCDTPTTNTLCYAPSEDEDLTELFTETP